MVFPRRSIRAAAAAAAVAVAAALTCGGFPALAAGEAAAAPAAAAAAAPAAPAPPSSVFARLGSALTRAQLPERVLGVLERVAPEAEATPGVDAVTRAAQALVSAEVREGLIAAVPETMDFPGTRFWQSVYALWNATEARGKAAVSAATARAAAGQPSPLQAARRLARTYNEYATWRADLPFKIYEEGVAAFRNVTAPAFEARTTFINSRDGAISAALSRQERAWAPATSASQALGEQIVLARGALSDAADRLLLGRATAALADARDLLANASGDAKYSFKAAQLCLMNPVCCTNPTACLERRADGD